jgi:thiol-disulfide isomerase/thioredoxin
MNLLLKKSYLALILLFFNIAFAKSTFQLDTLSLIDKKTQKEINFSNYKGIVFIGFLNGCPILAKYQPILHSLYKQYKDEILFINYMPYDIDVDETSESLKYLAKYENEFPFVTSIHKDLNHLLKITIASQIAIYSKKSNTIVYRGSIDDRANYDQFKDIPRFEYAKDVLLKISKEQKIVFKETTSYGCYFNLNKEK